MSVQTNALFANAGAAVIPGLTTQLVAPAAAAAKADKGPPANFWINVGYTAQVPMEDGSVEDRFVSLPFGIPLDTQKPVPTNSKNAETQMLLAAKNNLLEQLKALAAQLQPGQEQLIALQIQLRRVNDEAAIVAPNANPFIPSALKLVA